MKRPGRLRPFVPLVLALTLFPFLLHFRRLGPLDFWWAMGLVVAVLVVSALAVDRDYAAILREDVRTRPLWKIALGVLSAAALYGVFYLGEGLVRRFLPMGGEGIGAVYALRSGAPTLRIGLLLLVVIGPGEELFWRGYLQRTWQNRIGRAPALPFAVAVYTAVHIASGNPVLVLAAAVCGLFWGYLYLRSGSVLLVAVSHTVWDLAVFLLFPLV
jgi:membrane protease YdiL (CAAX protease family)